MSRIEMTEETQQQAEGAAQNDSCSAQQNETQLNSADVGKVKDNKKEKCRPMTKVRLDRILTDANFCLLDK